MSTKQSKFCADSKRDKMHIKVAGFIGKNL